MLKISTKGRYATRIMLYLASTRNGRPTPRQEIADAEDISADYVEQILAMLRTAGLVQSHRGARGGFSLTRAPGEITAADVLDATEGALALTPCETGDCDRQATCAARLLWRRASERLQDLFARTTVADMVRDSKRLHRFDS